MESSLQLAAALNMRTRQLNIRLAGMVDPPSSAHNLLVGFHFGEEHPHAYNPAVVSLDLMPLEHEHLFESWWYRGDVRVRQQRQLAIAECEDYSVVVLKTDETGRDAFEGVVTNAYKELVGAARTTRHTKIVKIWNYVGGINSGEGDCERYRQFSVGRANAFRALGIQDEDAPTGTAIGTSSQTGLTLIALSSKRSFGVTENPRQVSAFKYPRQYGPSSPKFSRGGFVAAGRHRLFLISGTASVVGHRSVFPYDTARQADETLRNLDFLCEAVSKLDFGSPRPLLDGNTVLRVYLRNPQDLELVAGKLKKALGRNEPRIVFLRGLICRRELMVEIDGARVTPA